LVKSRQMYFCNRVICISLFVKRKELPDFWPSINFLVLRALAGLKNGIGWEDRIGLSLVRVDWRFARAFQSTVRCHFKLVQGTNAYVHRSTFSGYRNDQITTLSTSTSTKPSFAFLMFLKIAMQHLGTSMYCTIE